MSHCVLKTTQSVDYVTIETKLGLTFSVYVSPNDGALVVELDTDRPVEAMKRDFDGNPSIRVAMNDQYIFDSGINNQQGIQPGKAFVLGDLNLDAIDAKVQQVIDNPDRQAAIWRLASQTLPGVVAALRRALSEPAKGDDS